MQAVATGRKTKKKKKKKKIVQPDEEAAGAAAPAFAEGAADDVAGAPAPQAPGLEEEEEDTHGARAMAAAVTLATHVPEEQEAISVESVQSV